MHLKNLGNSVNAISDIKNVFTSMENFSDIGKNAETIRRLQDVTSKYSDEVIKLSASQMVLTKEQLKAIFTAKGLTGAELDAAVAKATNSTTTAASTVSINLNTMSKVGNKEATKAQISEETKNLLIKENLVTAEQLEIGAKTKVLHKYHCLE